ncbi:hypothetical protein CBM2595_A30114 [Cupriavidus taiwanensis]|uniref:Uncharacterized protein n=1 Tax=Cupriavidus taiwanensis TaxID=164546 RepID=A0A7Z7J5H0_9BURK|nr:hypothetical protein CBM2595_A30114 [Cupriavidus taiwanensis]SPC08796.1 hypothetical protein CBM2594_A40119 [Cupriavidus taiwanensis]
MRLFQKEKRYELQDQWTPPGHHAPSA